MTSKNYCNTQIQNLEQAIEVIQALIAERNTFIDEMEQLRAENTRLKKHILDLEEKLRTNSQNSSKPPSQDPFRKQKKKRKKKSIDPKSIINSKSKRVRKGRAPTDSDSVSKILPCYPEKKCPSCGNEILPDLSSFQRKQQYEIPVVKPIITEYRIFSGTCRSCSQVLSGNLPPENPQGSLGPRALTFIAEMIGRYHLSRRELKGLLETHYSIPVSLGGLSQSEALWADVLSPAVAAAKEYIRKQPVVNMDETGHKESGKKQWMWTVVTQWITIFAIHISRGTAVVKELLGESFSGILGSDRYGAYNWVDKNRRQLCWAHLIRDLIRIAERSGSAERIGMEILAHVKRMFSLWHEVKNDTLSHQQFRKAMLPIRKAIESLLESGVKKADEKTQATCKNLLKFKEALWTFVEHEGVEPTNNVAERSLRPYVIWRKKSFGAQSKRGNTFIEVMMTVATSCRQQARNFHDFLLSSLQAHLQGTPKPSLLPDKAP